MVIISIVSYPPEHAKEMAKRMGELAAPPSYMTMKGPYVTGDLEAGIKVLVLYEYDQTKTREALEYVGNRLAKYFGVPGYTYSVHPWFEVKEALKMIGMG